MENKPFEVPQRNAKTFLPSKPGNKCSTARPMSFAVMIGASSPLQSVAMRCVCRVQAPPEPRPCSERKACLASRSWPYILCAAATDMVTDGQSNAALRKCCSYGSGVQFQEVYGSGAQFQEIYVYKRERYQKSGRAQVGVPRFRVATAFFCKATPSSQTRAVVTAQRPPARLSRAKKNDPEKAATTGGRSRHHGAGRPP